MTGTILTIQHYAVHDGPGIRTLVFMKGCPLRCAWCCNPEGQSLGQQLRHIRIRCRGCLECVTHCPLHAVFSDEGVISHEFDRCNECRERVCIERCNHEATSLSGKEISSEELAGIIALDIPFYRNSGGGVTFSGGEPLMQPAFLLDMLRKCKALGIHTAIETCGWGERKILQHLLPLTNLFLFDLKVIDPVRHRFFTGKPVGPILRNLAFLSSRGAEVTVRLPLVRGITDTPENIGHIADIMVQNGLSRICIEPYHTLGREKYDQHGMNYRLDDVVRHEPEQLNVFRNFFIDRGFQCEIL